VALFGVAAPLHSQTPDVFSPAALPLTFPQPDGKILCDFTLAGAPGTGRLNPDGSPDPSFCPAVAGFPIALQPDGKILTISELVTSPYHSSDTLWRLNPDGSLDPSFAAASLGTGVVSCVAVQMDGKVVVSGGFATLAGWPCTNLGRLNPDGSVDTAFCRAAPSPSGAAGPLVVPQADGKLLLGGPFTTLGGQPRNCLARLNPDGTLDAAFDAGIAGPAAVDCVALQADGKMLVYGGFTTLGGQACTNFGRLNPDGSLDPGFHPAEAPTLSSIAVQADGSLLVGGSFWTRFGNARTDLARLNSDGSLDASFDAAFDPDPIWVFVDFGIYPYVSSVALEEDGKLLVSGFFDLVGGQPRTNYARLNNTGPATNDLTFDGSTITWLRGGTGPEVWGTVFEGCTNGSDWFGLGAGHRTAGGWQADGASLPPGASIRACGFVQSGNMLGSTWFVEAIIGPPAIAIGPMSQTRPAGAVAGFSVDAGGSLPLAYQWRKDGRDLADGGVVSGALTPALTLSNVLHADAGAYSVLVSNSLGKVVSARAVLTVLDPAVSSQPTNQLANAGQTVAVDAGVAGTPPLGFQWLRDGVPLPGATSMPLLLKNVQWGDGGNYQLTISNAFGTVTSAPAVLAVNLAAPDSFDPGADYIVAALAVQTDGKVVVGGQFMTLAGQPCESIGRLNPDGSLDAGFNPDANLYPAGVTSVAVQADGSVLASDSVQVLAPDGGTVGAAWGLVWRTAADGSSADLSLNAHCIINAVAVQVDGKILVGGNFATLNGQPCSNIGRLNRDGTLDTNFTASADDIVYSLAIQPDGKILVGGEFRRMSGLALNDLGGGGEAKPRRQPRCHLQSRSRQRRDGLRAPNRRAHPGRRVFQPSGRGGAQLRRAA
jgi:uncharacterized delta-60 repeat protein